MSCIKTNVNKILILPFYLFFLQILKKDKLRRLCHFNNNGSQVLTYNVFCLSFLKYTCSYLKCSELLKNNIDMIRTWLLWCSGVCQHFF